MSQKTVLIGGVAGGATTAARLRRRSEDMEIIILERGDYISYANCGLPYYIGDVIKSRDALLLQTPEEMSKKFNIDIRTSNEATKILPKEKKILVKNLKSGEKYEEAYDNLVIATGSSPFVPPIPGVDGDNIVTLWTIPDTDKIKSIIDKKHPKTAAVIGGGFIGLEVAENLHQQGINVSLIEMQDQVLAPLDLEMASILHENIKQNDINLLLKEKVEKFEQRNEQTIIHLASGNSIYVDLVIMSVGIRPNSQLASDADIELNNRGGIIVNEYLETSQKDIYAVGDVIEVNDYITKGRTMIPLAGPANKQARILADNLTGELKKYNGTMGTSVVKVFDYNIATTGLNEKQLNALDRVKGEDYFTALIAQKSHAGYYPGATPMFLKMIFDKNGKIYGGQIVGQDGVDKRIDTLATTIRLNGTIHDLKELELAYAPPFSSAKDPVNMLGFVAENILTGMVEFTSVDELDNLIADDNSKDNYTIFDIREDMEAEIYSIPNSYHIPLGQVRERLNELDRNKKIIVYCAVGIRSYIAARILMQNGFKDVSVLEGGTSLYRSIQNANKPYKGFKNNTDNNHKSEKEEPTIKDLKIVDCCGLQCPGPIMKVNETIKEMDDGEIAKISATDMGFASDIDSWCKRTGNLLIKKERVGKENIVYVKKGSVEIDAKTTNAITELPQGKTLIVFSGDLDKALASFIIANGAAAMGRPVTMFFTFWGLNILRKSEKIRNKKPFMDKMFGKMMPQGASKLSLSKMHMGGMGTRMMKNVMLNKNVDSLEILIEKAKANGVKLVACTMSMDIMGITRQELIDGIDYAGVATYLADAEESNVNLFI